jgi:hypothetical protein
MAVVAKPSAMNAVSASTQLLTKTWIGTNVHNVKQPDITAIKFAQTATAPGFYSWAWGMQQRSKRALANESLKNTEVTVFRVSSVLPMKPFLDSQRLPAIPAIPSKYAVLSGKTTIFVELQGFKKEMVRSSGFEPPRYCYRQPLKLVRLPVPPRPHRGKRFHCSRRLGNGQDAGKQISGNGPNSACFAGPCLTTDSWMSATS